MAAIAVSVDIARPQEEVFGYVTDPSRFGEWQQGVIRGSIDGGGRPAIGSKCTMTRRIGGSERASTSVVTKLDPPTSWAVHGIDGPIRAIVDVMVTVAEAAAGSHVTITLDFEGHGIGKLLVPLVVRRQAANEMPKNMQSLKERLESQPGTGS